MDKTPFDASGYVHNNGRLDAEGFKTTFGFDHSTYPQYFAVRGDGRVWATDKFRKDCDAYFAQHRTNLAALGVSCK